MTIEQAPKAQTLRDVRARRDTILDVAARRGAHNVRVFGSVAADRAAVESDLDFLVDLEPGRSFFDLGGLLMDLQSLLGVEVDVVTADSLRPAVRAVVLAEAVPL
ncbi:MAG: nucleotidyltransferase family protein [Acidimicrobiia bacterium]